MNKKTNTVLFMIVATVVNLLLLILFFGLGFILLTLYMNANPESSLAPMLIGLVFLLSIALSFIVYSKLVKFVVAKFQLEDKMEPLFGARKRTGRPKNDE